MALNSVIILMLWIPFLFLIFKIEKANEFFIKEVVNKEFLEIFRIKGIIRKRVRENKPQDTWEFIITSKPLGRFLITLFDIPRGKKSHKVRMPEIIRNLEPVKRIPFIVGLMDTDWGHHLWRFGTGSASKKLILDTADTLESLLKTKIGCKHTSTASFMWLTFKQTKELNNLLNNTFPLQNEKRIRTINKILNSYISEPRGVVVKHNEVKT